MKNYPLILLFILSVCLSFTKTNANPSSNNPIELGEVNWIRSLDKGIETAKKSKKPIFLLFQEVPGCATCQRYGQQVLSHPLIVEAIEDLFTPVAIFNNKGGVDAQVLKYFGEPAWNNPVVRIVNGKKKDLVKRLGGVYTPLGVVQGMVQALQAVNATVPTYLSLLEKELLAENTGLETANLSMYCFWTGEKEIGKIDGVVGTLPGFMGGREIVMVQFDPEIVSYDKLVQQANKKNCASHVFYNNSKQERQAANVIGTSSVSPSASFRLDKDLKYYLSKTNYQYVPMTPLQALKVNSAIGDNRSPDNYLSPRQVNLVNYFKKEGTKKIKNVINEDFVTAWKEIRKVIKREFTTSQR